MIILSEMPTETIDSPVCALNAVWFGSPQPTLQLPQMGHLFLICPLHEAVISCAGAVVDSDHYLLLTLPAGEHPYRLDCLHSDEQSRLLVLLFSPEFILEMADFLSIPADLSDLLHAVPLLKGDMLSRLMQLMVNTLSNREQAEELYFELVGQVLRFLRLRHETLLSLAGYKQTTVEDLLPRLLRARQFIEARYLEPIKTENVAAYLALSEYHFARLFKAAFDLTVHQYVMRLRMDEARHLLETSAMSVLDVGLSVGYNSPSAFIRAFRRDFGMTPSDYQVRFARDEK